MSAVGDRVSTDPGGLFRFGTFQADIIKGELYRNGEKVRLQEKPFKFLAVLLSHPGENRHPR